MPTQKNIKTKVSLFFQGKMDRVGSPAKESEEGDGPGRFPGQRAQVGLDTLVILQLIFGTLLHSPSPLLNPFLFSSSPMPSSVSRGPRSRVHLPPPTPTTAPDQISYIRSEKGRPAHTHTSQDSSGEDFRWAPKTHFFFCRRSGIFFGIGSCYCFPDSHHR